MANRFFNQFSKTMEKEVVSLFAHVTFGASGAATLDAVNSKGIVSVVKQSTGKYRILFGTTAASKDSYYKFFNARATFLNATAPAAPMMYITSLQHNVVANCYIDVQFSTAAGVSTDPASGEQVYMEIKLGNSSAQ
jgi:hypothetical protein